MSPQPTPEPLGWFDVILAFIVLQVAYRVAGVQQWGFPQGLCPSRAERRFEEELDELVRRRHHE